MPDDRTTDPTDEATHDTPHDGGHDGGHDARLDMGPDTPERRPEFPTPTITVEVWADPVVDRLGHDPRSAYVERFWLPVMGPSTIWFLRRIADALDRSTDGVTLDLLDTARALGVGMRGGRNSPMMRTIDRCCRFGAARVQGPAAIAVRRRLAPLTRANVERLPEALQAEHQQWLSAPRTSPAFDEMQRRARTLAHSLVELGEPTIDVERQLHRLRFHPAIAHEAMRWAVAQVPAATDPAAGMSAAERPGQLQQRADTEPGAPLRRLGVVRV